MSHERVMLTEFIQLYSTLPCLWDPKTVEFKDKLQKAEAWELLTNKLREFDPDSNVTKTKRKMENLRTAYRRELRKVKLSKKAGKDIRRPYLWYFDLLESFLPKKETDSRDVIDRDSTSDEESQSSERENKVRDYVPELKRSRLQERLQSKTNSFGEYIGEELENVESFQRHVAEKLISEILFLARTGHLTFDTKIETSNCVDSEPSLSDSHPTSVYVHSSLAPRVILPHMIATSSNPPSDVKPASFPQVEERVSTPSPLLTEIKDEFHSD